jgi:hypothetical protein
MLQRDGATAERVRLRRFGFDAEKFRIGHLPMSLAPDLRSSRSSMHRTLGGEIV